MNFATNRTYTLIRSRILFFISLLVIVLTICGVYLLGLGQHRSFYKNSMISTSLLSFCFLSFITIGLYLGIKLKDDLGKITKPFSWPDFNKERNSGANSGVNWNFLEGLGSADLGGAGGGCLEFFGTVLLWLLFTAALSFVLIVFSQVFYVIVLAFAGMLYWIFFRALRLVFKNSSRCKGKLWHSFRMGIGYTLLYNFWIYGIFFIIHAWKF